MAKRDDVFPSRFLRAADLKGKPVTVKIEHAVLETLKGDKEETKTVLYFADAKKCLPLNRTNWDAVADVTGEDDSDAWRGHQIELFPTTTEMKGKTVECIRIRPPAQAALKAKAKPPAPKQPASNEMDDEIPF
jgi:hypothetical protein